MSALITKCQDQFLLALIRHLTPERVLLVLRGWFHKEEDVAAGGGRGQLLGHNSVI